ncbi:uncharacterized protein LOC122371180 [Amphibalanus amphitrite]|uniref:uncharacterized protein LOC122371180 n=1 Tax=Amphibalanus amphitrite TaxID=1232801 RepID=UPI001C920E52|nr:uncharacterized protein LOC122371180 [Amphibalanus amphitrite]
MEGRSTSAPESACPELPTETSSQEHSDRVSESLHPSTASSILPASEVCNTMADTLPSRDIHADESALFMEDDEAFLGDLTSFLDDDSIPCDLNFDPIESEPALETAERSTCNANVSSRTVLPSELDDLLDMVMMSGYRTNETRDDVQHWMEPEIPETYHENQYDLSQTLLSSSFPSLFDGSADMSPIPRHYRSTTQMQPSSTCATDEWRSSEAGVASTSLLAAPGVDQWPSAPPASLGAANIKLERSRVTATVTSASVGNSAANSASGAENSADDSCVSSTSPDFPGPSFGSPYVPAAQDDPYFPLPALEVILMSSEARFMHLVQTLCREFPTELHQFMLVVSGDRGITPPPADGQVMSVKGMLELRREIEQVQPIDTLLLERIITESEHKLGRHERILKEILRITCRGDMSQWERKLVWGREERKRLQDETDNANSASTLKRHRALQKSTDPLLGGVIAESEVPEFSLEEVADEISVTSLESDTEPDQTDLPHAFCYPKGPDLLRSNRDVAHPHLEAPVADSVCQTQFGKVKFSVYPGIRWGRDPLRKKKRLERKLSEVLKDGEADVFICDDLLEDLDMESSVESLLQCLTQHNLRCPKAAEWQRSRSLSSLERSTTSCRASRPSTSHLIIRKMSDGTPFLDGAGQRASTRTMDREEFLSQLADGRMTLATQPPEHYNQLLVKRSETDGKSGCSGSRRMSETGLIRHPVSLPGLPSQQDISLASQVAKDLLSRQTRDLYRSSMLRSDKREEMGVSQPGRLGKGRDGTGLDRQKRGLETREGNGAFSAAATSSNDNDSHWKNLMDSVLQPRSRSRSSTSSDRKRSLDFRHESSQRKRHFSLGTTRPRDLSKHTRAPHPPTILLQGVPLASTACTPSVSHRSTSLHRQPLLLPKPAVSISSTAIHTSISMQSSSGSVGKLGSFSTRLSRGYDTLLGTARGRGHAVGTGPRQDGGRLVPLEPESVVVGDGREQQPAEGEGSALTEPASVTAEEAKRVIMEPPSPKSLQARDKILRAMVSVTDDTDDVTSMHYHRPRHCDFRRLGIGGFLMEPAGGRGRLKIIYSARKIVYEFDYPPASEECEQRQLVHIEVKFSSVIALQSSTEELRIVVCQIPTVLVGRPSSEPVSQRGRPCEAGTGDPTEPEITNTDPRLRAFVSGDIRDSPLHLLQLSQAACEAACRTLGRVSRRFHDMLCCPPRLDGYVPRWRLVSASDVTSWRPASTSDVTGAAVGAAGGAGVSQEGCQTWLQSGQPQSCNCRFSCRSLDCPCSRASLPCGYGSTACRCGPGCSNTFNAVLEEGIDVETAREDTCLVQNVFAVNKPKEIRRLLSDSQPCPHCHLLVEIRSVVPMQRPCPHCSKPVVFSWCQRKLRDSRNHCLVCIGCSEVNFQHCLLCKFCTRRTRQHGPCTQCAARGEQWRTSRRYVTAEGQLFSRQLMSELRLTPTGAGRDCGGPATSGEGDGPSATV